MVSTTTTTTTTHDLPWTVSLVLSGVEWWNASLRMEDWDGRAVVVVSALVLQVVYHVVGKRGGVDWYALAHAVVAATGALACVYLDAYAAEPLTGVSEPLRLVRCDGDGHASPLTPLHSVLPLVTLGYGLSDMMDGIASGSRDVLFHGVLLSAAMGTVWYAGVQHTVVPMLLMEASSVPLNLKDATFLSDRGRLVCTVLFVLTFFLVRLVYVPYSWGRFLWIFYHEHTLHHDGDSTGSCYPKNFIYVVLVLGLLFHGLNLYWMKRIVRHVQRKLAGGEKTPKPASAKQL